MEIDADTHVICTRFWLYKNRCDRSSIRAMLTIGCASLLEMVLPNYLASYHNLIIFLVLVKLTLLPHLCHNLCFYLIPATYIYHEHTIIFSMFCCHQMARVSVGRGFGGSAMAQGEAPGKAGNSLDQTQFIWFGSHLGSI